MPSDGSMAVLSSCAAGVSTPRCEQVDPTRLVSPRRGSSGMEGRRARIRCDGEGDSVEEALSSSSGVVGVQGEATEEPSQLSSTPRRRWREGTSLGVGVGTVRTKKSSCTLSETRQEREKKNWKSEKFRSLFTFLDEKFLSTHAVRNSVAADLFPRQLH